MKMDGMNVVAGIAHTDTIALTLAEMIDGGHSLAGKHLVINGPQVEALCRGILLCKGFPQGHYGYVWALCEIGQ